MFLSCESESEVTQSCLTLRDPMDCSLPGSSVHGIFQARVLEWGAIAFSEIMPYLDTNQNIMYRVCMCKTKHTDGRNESFSFFNGMVSHVYILEDSILLRCQLSLT